MATKRRNQSATVEDLLREQIEATKTQMIVQMALASIPQGNIRKVVGCDIYRVSAVVKNLRTANQNG